MIYRKKPVVIHAIQWTGENHRELREFTKLNFGASDNGNCIVKTLEGEHIASIGDYIIKGIKGEFYPCKPDIFEMTYDLVCDTNSSAKD